MKMKVFSVFDSAVQAYMQPFFMKHTGEAKRAIVELVNDDKHNFSKYASDLTLFEIGSFDDNTCKFDLHLTPISLGVLVEFKHPREGFIELETRSQENA